MGEFGFNVIDDDSEDTVKFGGIVVLEADTALSFNVRCTGANGVGITKAISGTFAEGTEFVGNITGLAVTVGSVAGYYQENAAPANA